MVTRDICYRYYTRFSHRIRDDVSVLWIRRRQLNSLPDLRVGRRMACQSDIHELPWEGGGVTVERGNLGQNRLSA